MGLRLLALACLVGAALAGPLRLQNERQCAKQCSHSTNHLKFGYEIGKTYTYEYRGENIVSATGKPRQKATIEGLAIIQVVDTCGMVLQLKNLRIEQKLSPEEIDQLTQKLEIPLPFSYDDGEVEQVCPSPDEDTQSLNIKKGLISSFVNTMSQLDTPQEVKEFDSLGHCMTKYTVKSAQGLEIRKQKSLKSCTNRHSSVTSMITNPYEAPGSMVHTLPIFPDEQLECTQVVENKIIKSVQCREHAKIKPLSQRSSIIQFEGEVQLNLLSINVDSPIQTWLSSHPESSQSFQEPNPSAHFHVSAARKAESEPFQSQATVNQWAKQESLMFNYEEPKDVQSRERETEQLLREMCSKNEQTMDISVSKDFIQLVSLVKGLPYSSLSKIYSSLKSGRLCSSKKVQDLFVDTLPMTGSDAAIKHMVKLLESKEITGLKAKLWPASLALIPNPSREAVAEIIPLLRMQSSEQESSQPSPVILLGVSAMVHRFCSVHDCENERSVQEITSILNQQIGQQCSNENDSQVLSALKAFGNMGHHGKTAEQNILACVQNKDKPTRLRLAAIDAFRRINQKRPEELIQIYGDSQDIPEVRIAAFSSVMKQSDEQQLRSIKRIVEQESDEQVSAYVSSFLKNMKTTSSPLKKSVKRALEQVEINPPKVSYWQNSKNIEFSTFSETFNLGGSVETDIVHSPESKIPQSITTRFDADVLNNNMNIFEIGVRAEGLEAIFKNLLGLKDKISQSSSSWNLLKSENVFGGVEAEASAFIRTMNTEILDLSVSDLSGVGEMIKIADLMNQLAQGKISDFSQSFLFLNSKVVIPSVTGRSYSLGVTGSATVGLTATTKLDIMRFPRNTDAHARFQPSLNVELSTTVGIQSSQNRPDIKLSTRMHLESNMEAQFKIRDGHYAIASITLPSENVVLARVSSDVVEVDSHHQERPVFERMQKKVDYCFDKLQKPFGISVCGMLEVPKPFISRSFPFIYGVGSIEFAIKKTDRGLKAFELKLERPRHSAPVQKYRASFDTPGSQVNRRFAAELDVSRQGQESQQYSLELISPFKNSGGKGSVTRRGDLVEGSFEIHSSSSPLITVNASSQISSSRAKVVYKPSIEVTIRNKSPLQVGGVISVTQGRKQVISIDMQANKPSTRPISLRGSITKEGSIILSKKAEWKVSSDLSLESSFLDAQVRSMLEKQSKQAQTLSASIETEYKKGSQRHSMSLSGTTQQSSSKISTNAQFQSTQFPSTSWSLKWERQGKPMQTLKNDVTFRYGKNPERNFVSVRQSSNIPPSGPGHCNVVVKAPQLNIDSELMVTHELLMSEGTHKLQLEADLSYKQDKHIKGSLLFDHPSVRPLKASTKLQIELPSGKLTYSDEVEETSTNKFEGNTRMQWQENRPLQVKYIYQILSDRSKFHHEIDASLQLPSKQSPIQSKCSLQVRGQTVKIDASLSSRRSSDYSIQAQLTPSGTSSLRLQSPVVDGDLKVQNEEQKKAFDLDLRVKGSRPRRVIASTKAQLGQKKSFEIEMSLDSEKKPENKLSFTSKGEITSSSYSAVSQLQIYDLLSVSLTESGQSSLLGNHEGSLEASIKNSQPVRLDYSHKLSSGQCKCQLKFSQNQIEKFEAKLEGKAIKSSNGRDLGIKASLTSLDNSFQSKAIELSHSSQTSGASTEKHTSIRVQKSPSKIYKAEISSESQPQGVQVRAKVNTPHPKFSQQSALMSFRSSEGSIASTISIELPENKVVSISSTMQKRSHETTATINVKSPFQSARDVKVHISVDNHRSKKSLLSYLDVNSARLADVEATMTKSPSEKLLQCQLKVSPSARRKFQGLNMSYKQSRSSVELSGAIQMQGEKTVSVSSQISNQRSGLSASFNLNTPFRKLQSVDASLALSRNSAELSGSAQYMGDKKISMSSQLSKERSKLSATATLSTPYSVKEAKAHISIESESSQKSLLAFVDANGQRKGDIEMTYSSLSNGMELKSRMKTASSQEVSALAKLEKSEKSFSLQAKMVKGASTLLSSINRRQSPSMEQTIFDVQVSRQSSRNSNLYSMKLSGPVSPVTLSLSSSRSEDKALNLEASACQESQQVKCYTLKTIKKSSANSEGYRSYQRLSLEVEKTTNSRSEPICSANFIVTAAANDYKSQITVDYKGQTLGYEVRAHKRVNQDDHCSIDAHIFMPSQTSRFRASILHKPSRLSLEVEATPDSSLPQKKFVLEMQKEHSQNSNELSAYFKLSSPQNEKPVLLTIQMQKQGLIPVQGKCELLYFSSRGSQQKKLTLEISSHLQQRSPQKKFISYKLYNADQSIEASLEMKKENSRQQVSYGYEWSYKKQQSSLKKGGVSIKLSQKQNGRPQNVDISYYSPNVALELQGRLAQAPQDVKLSLLSSGQKVKEFRIVTTDNCVEMQVQQSEPILKTSFCINKRVGEAMQFVAVDAYYRRHKSLDCSIGIDPQTASFITIQMQWDKQDIVKALEEITGLNELLHDPSLQQVKDELRRELRLIKSDVMPIYKELMEKLQQLRQQHRQQVENVFGQPRKMLQDQAQKLQQSLVNWVKSLIPWDYINNEVLLPLTQTLKCLMDTYFQLALKHIPDITRIVLEATKEQLEYCLKKFCVAGTFCYDIRRVYERQGLQQAQALAIQKLMKTTDTLQKQIAQEVSQRTEKLIENIKHYAQDIERIINTIVQSEEFEKLTEYAIIVGEKLFHYGSEFVEKFFEKLGDIFHAIGKDEDFQTIRSLTKFMTEGIENQVKSIWNNRETYIRQVKSIMQKIWESRHYVYRQIQRVWENRDKFYSQLQSLWKAKDKYVKKAMEQLQKVWENRESHFQQLKSVWHNRESHIQQLKNAWQNRHALAKQAQQELEPLKEIVMNKTKEMMKGRVEVPQFDLHEGDIKVLIRHPFQQRHIQVVQNLLRACKQKLEQVLSS